MKDRTLNVICFDCQEVNFDAVGVASDDVPKYIYYIGQRRARFIMIQFVCHPSHMSDLSLIIHHNISALIVKCFPSHLPPNTAEMVGQPHEAKLSKLAMGSTGIVGQCWLALATISLLRKACCMHTLYMYFTIVSISALFIRVDCGFTEENQNCGKLSSNRCTVYLRI